MFPSDLSGIYYDEKKTIMILIAEARPDVVQDKLDISVVLLLFVRRFNQ